MKKETLQLANKLEEAIDDLKDIIPQLTFVRRGGNTSSIFCIDAEYLKVQQEANIKIKEFAEEQLKVLEDMFANLCDETQPFFAVAFTSLMKQPQAEIDEDDEDGDKPQKMIRAPKRKLTKIEYSEQQRAAVAKMQVPIISNIPTQKCPHGHRFGYDNEDEDECDECTLWQACYKRHQEIKKEKRQKPQPIPIDEEEDD